MITDQNLAADLKKLLDGFTVQRPLCAHETERVDDDGLVFLMCRKCGQNVIMSTRLDEELDAQP